MSRRVLLLASAGMLVIGPGPSGEGTNAARPPRPSGCPSLGLNLVRDGGFEQPKTALVEYDPLVAGQSIGPWKVDYGSVDHIADSCWVAAEGLQSVDLDGCTAGGISQELNVQPGREYLLCFALAGNYANAPLVKSLEVWWGNELVDSLSFDISGRSRRDMGWTYHYYTVTPSVRKLTLSFRSTTPGCYGPAIDDVSVQEMPTL